MGTTKTAKKHIEDALSNADKKLHLIDGISDRLKKLRMKQDSLSSIPRALTLQELAEFLGDHQSNLSRYEAGPGKKYGSKPSLQMMVKFASIYGVTLDYLLFNERSDGAEEVRRAEELVRDYEQEIHQLKEKLNSKEELIATQKALIASLTGK